MVVMVLQGCSNDGGSYEGMVIVARLWSKLGSGSDGKVVEIVAAKW